MSEGLGTVDRPKERPFPWYCPRCRKKDVWREVIRYQCRRMSHGRLVDIVVPDLAVPRCRSCGELVFDYAAESQINAKTLATDLDPVQAPSSVARQKGGCKMTKYQPLRDYLTARQDLERVRMTFSEVAAILGEPLPESAFKYREWWANQTDTSNRPWAAAWLDAGFAVDAIHQDGGDGWVEFARR